jgi:hypothetical protein
LQVISIAHYNGAEEIIVTASGRELTALEGAIYHRLLELERTGLIRTEHGETLTRMLDDVRQPYEAKR